MMIVMMVIMKSLDYLGVGSRRCTAARFGHRWTLPGRQGHLHDDIMMRMIMFTMIVMMIMMIMFTMIVMMIMMIIQMMTMKSLLYHNQRQLVQRIEEQKMLHPYDI